MKFLPLEPARPRAAFLAAAAFVLGGLLPIVSASAASPRPPAVDSATARQLFANPPVEYSTGMLWVWNDLLDERQIRETLRDLASQGVRQPYVHPRPGLMTPYLSPEWFRLWKIAVDESKKLGLKLWIYDENSYPSGFAGGLVPEVMPGSRGMGLSIVESATPPRWQDNSVAVHRLEAARAENLSASAQRGEVLPAGRYANAMLLTAGSSPWFGNRFYVNLLTPGVTAKFLDVTLEAYRRELGAEFGGTIPGVFTDEPQMRPAGGYPWCEDLPAQFAQRWGYSLLDALPSLAFDVGDWRKVRHNYLQVLNELFAERWCRPYFEYCVAHNLEATGHYWEHEWPVGTAVPDSMTAYAWQHRPGIDTLMNEYTDGPNAQFGNARAVREIASVANQLGRRRTFCEAYGAGGWDLRFEDMKRIGDWLLVLGTNTLVEHLSYVTIRGGRKRDHPQSFSYHEPWWPAYHVSADYQARLSAALSQGEQRNDILLLEPTTTAWMYNLGRNAAATLKTLGTDFQAMVNAFEREQIGYDLGSEYILARNGSVAAGKLRVGQRDYAVVVLPKFTENLNAPTCALLEQFLRGGGTVLCGGEPPPRIDGSPSPRGAALARQAGWRQLDSAAAVAWLAARGHEGFAIRRAEADPGLLFHHRRQLADGELLFLVNTSAQQASAGTIVSSAKSIERWNPESGKTSPYAFAPRAGGVSAEFALPPAGSLLLLLATRPGASAPPVAGAKTIVASGGPEIRRAEPNVLTLDFVDVTAGGQTRRNMYCYDAAQFVFKQGGEPRNRWESAVQFGDELLKREFAANSGFAASYHFALEQAVPANLTLVVERPDLYSISCNGKPVAAQPGAWWLDRAFGVIDLSRAAQIGANTVTIQAARLTNFHELEPAYLRGDFRLRATGDGFVVVPDAPLTLGRWNEQGHPLYAAGVTYREKFNLPAIDGTFAVSAPKWYGSVARVRVNGVDAGPIGWAPWESDVTKHLRRGENIIELTVIGTLKNTLGPHHGNPPLGRAWPAAFRAAPKDRRAAGSEYSTVGYGLLEPFVLLQRTASEERVSQ